VLLKCAKGRQVDPEQAHHHGRQAGEPTARVMTAGRRLTGQRAECARHGSCRSAATARPAGRPGWVRRVRWSPLACSAPSHRRVLGCLTAHQVGSSRWTAARLGTRATARQSRGTRLQRPQAQVRRQATAAGTGKDRAGGEHVLGQDGVAEKDSAEEEPRSRWSGRRWSRAPVTTYSPARMANLPVVSRNPRLLLRSMKRSNVGTSPAQAAGRCTGHSTDRRKARTRAGVPGRTRHQCWLPAATASPTTNPARTSPG
jgi:hypothetical protein